LPVSSLIDTIQQRCAGTLEATPVAAVLRLHRPTWCSRLFIGEMRLERCVWANNRHNIGYLGTRRGGLSMAGDS
jgi:hypothetical protein